MSKCKLEWIHWIGVKWKLVRFYSAIYKSKLKFAKSKQLIWKMKYIKKILQYKRGLILGGTVVDWNSDLNKTWKPISLIIFLI